MKKNKYFKKKIGQLLWVCNQTRLDVTFDISNITSNLKNATILDLKLCLILSLIQNYEWLNN